MTGVPPCVSRVHGQVGTGVEEVGHKDPGASGEGLDDFADNGYHLQLTRLAAQVDHLVLADQLDVAALVRDKAIRSQVVRFAEIAEVLDCRADLLE